MLKRILNKISFVFFRCMNAPYFGSVGKNSFINKPILIDNKKDIFLGDNILIRDGARIETIHMWGGVKYTPRIVIEDNCNFEQGVHITCANEIIIHENCSFTPYCCITDIEHEYKNVNKPVKEQSLTVTRTEIGRDCFFGTGAKIVKGVTIGEHVIIGANAVVTHDIPAFCLAAGNPAKVIKRYNHEKDIWERIE